MDKDVETTRYVLGNLLKIKCFSEHKKTAFNIHINNKILHVYFMR